MTTDDADEQLARLRKQIRHAVKRGDAAEVERLRALYGRVKREQMERAEEDHRAAARARRAQQRAVEPEPSPERWRLPFRRSPGAVERDRRLPVESAPQIPPGGLRPWRRGWHPASERIWWPGG